MVAVKSAKAAKKAASTKLSDLRWVYSVTGAYVEHYAATEYESEKSYLVLKIRVTNELGFSSSTSLANLFELYQSGLEIAWAYATNVEGTELSAPKMLPGVSYEGWTAGELRDTSSPATLYECRTSVGYKNLNQSIWDVSNLEVKEAWLKSKSTPGFACRALHRLQEKRRRQERARSHSSLPAS